MSKEKDTNVTINVGGIFFIAFLILKFGGNAYAASWSLWWLLMPIVPVLATLFKAGGLL